MRRERQIVWFSLAAMVVLAWVYLFQMAKPMPGMNMSAMQMPGGYGISTAVLLFLMWAVMMVAMMVPSAAPMLRAFLEVNERRKNSSRQMVTVGIFLLGYIVVWTGFSAAATAAQWGLHKAALLSPMMISTSPLVSGGLLLCAGAFQWTPLKRTCLRSCRSPLSFLMAGWREGNAGAFDMGLRHGAYCVGCCWALMALLFVVGVMNLIWIAVIAIFVMAEKVIPHGELLGHVAGVTLVGAGVAVMAKI